MHTTKMRSSTICSVAFVLLAIAVGFGFHTLARAPLIPVTYAVLSDEIVFGDAESSEAIFPFTVPEQSPIDEAHIRARLSGAHVAGPPLAHTRSPTQRHHTVDTSVVGGRTYGVNASELETLVTYWKDAFQWNSSQTIARLRALPHFRTVIRGLGIHFIHIRADIAACDVRHRIPLLLIHGWPGSVLEFLDAVPHLAKPCGPDGTIFDLVIPSLPGFGFSDAPTKPGCNVLASAHMLLELMRRLGYEDGGYVVQGGDWGSMVATAMAQVDAAQRGATTSMTAFPAGVRGIHINMVTTFSPLTPFYYLAHAVLPTSLRRLFVSDADVERGRMPLTRFAGIGVDTTGYMHLQATRPDTLGVALADSPVGFAAWVLEKFAEWADVRAEPGHSVVTKFSPDWLISNLMMYMATGRVVSALRYYKESLADAALWDSLRSAVLQPSAIADFPIELLRSPRAIAEYQFHNLVHYASPAEGGHFAAAEVPRIFATDVHAAARVIWLASSGEM